MAESLEMERSALDDFTSADPLEAVSIRSPGNTVYELDAGAPLTWTVPEPINMAPLVAPNASEQDAANTKTTAAIRIITPSRTYIAKRLSNDKHGANPSQCMFL